MEERLNLIVIILFEEAKVLCFGNRFSMKIDLNSGDRNNTEVLLRTIDVEVLQWYMAPTAMENILQI